MSQKGPTAKTSGRKKTDCQAYIKVTIYHPVATEPELLRIFPTEVELHDVHNHNRAGFEALKYRKPTKETDDKIMAYFSKGHNRVTARDMLQDELKDEYGHDFTRLYDASHTSRLVEP